MRDAACGHSSCGRWARAISFAGACYLETIAELKIWPAASVLGGFRLLGTVLLSFLLVARAPVWRWICLATGVSRYFKAWVAVSLLLVV